MSVVVGLDPSLTACGISVLRGNIRCAISTADVTPTAVMVDDLRAVGHRGRDGASFDDRSDRIVAQTRFVLKYVPVDADLVVIEDLPYMKKPLPSFRDRTVLWGGIYAGIRARRTPVAVCNVATLKAWATGKGNAEKAEVLAAVREQWPGENRIRNDNHADAMTVAAMGALRLGWPLPFEIKDRHHAGLEKVAWPKEITHV